MFIINGRKKGWAPLLADLPLAKKLNETRHVTCDMVKGEHLVKISAP